MFLAMLDLVLMAATSSPATSATQEAEGVGLVALPLTPAARDWPGAMVIIIAGMFLAALVVGKALAANRFAEPPERSDAHDDAHGPSTHH